MNVLLTLNSGLGSDLGPNFDLTTNVGIVTPNTAILSDLLAGKNVIIDGTATEIVVTSTGTCTNSLTIPISS